MVVVGDIKTGRLCRNDRLTINLSPLYGVGGIVWEGFFGDSRVVSEESVFVSHIARHASASILKVHL